MRAAVQQLMMCNKLPPPQNKSSWLLSVLFISMHVAASALLALGSSTAITTVGKQDTLETLVTCCLLCVHAGLFQTQLCGPFLMPFVSLYLQERKLFKL